MKALILAAGFGVRLREIVHGRPKHLAPIHGRPFLHYLVSLLRENGIVDLVLAVGYLSDQIQNEMGDGRRFGVTISYSIDDRPLGTAGTIKYAQRFFSSDFFVVNGDTYIPVDFQDVARFHASNRADVTLVGTTSHLGSGGLFRVRGKRFVEFVKGNGRGLLTNTGVYVFSPGVLGFLRRGERASLEHEFLPLLRKAGRKILVYRTVKEYFDIGTPERYLEAQKKLTKL